MTRLVWGAIGERFFEAGVDRGVLYVNETDGVAWNGLVSVTESPTGGEISEYFIDGMKYLQHAAADKFEATIEAYTYPEEFEACDGTASAANGLKMTHQPKKEFGLSYRTKVGNDVDGEEHGYKLHLVYNALAEPTQRTNKSLGESIDPDNFSWHLVTRPPDLTGYKPTAHLVVDSRESPRGLLLQIEDILYGNDDESPRLPSPAEMIFLFKTYGSSVFDAGDPDTPYFVTFDGGTPPDTIQTSTIDGGAP